MAFVLFLAALALLLCSVPDSPDKEEDSVPDASPEPSFFLTPAFDASESLFW